MPQIHLGADEQFLLTVPEDDTGGREASGDGEVVEVIEVGDDDEKMEGVTIEEEDEGERGIMAPDSAIPVTDPIADPTPAESVSNRKAKRTKRFARLGPGRTIEVSTVVTRSDSSLKEEEEQGEEMQKYVVLPPSMDKEIGDSTGALAQRGHYL